MSTAWLSAWRTRLSPSAPPLICAMANETIRQLGVFSIRMFLFGESAAI